MVRVWPHGTPERAVADAFAALRAGDGLAFTALATPASMERYVARRLARGNPLGPTGLTDEGFRGLFPEIPAAVIDWQLSLRRQAAAAMAAQYQAEFAGLAVDAGSLDAATASEVLAHLVRSGSRAYTRAGCTPLGHVPEGAETAHVVYRVGAVSHADAAPDAVVPQLLTVVYRNDRRAATDRSAFDAGPAWLLVLDAAAPLGLPGLPHIEHVRITETRDLPSGDAGGPDTAR